MVQIWVLYDKGLLTLWSGSEQSAIACAGAYPEDIYFYADLVPIDEEKLL